VFVDVAQVIRCATCNQEGHRRSSSKKCPMHKMSKRDFVTMLIDDNEQNVERLIVTTKTGLSSILKDEHKNVLMRTFSDISAEVTGLVFEVSRCVNRYLTETFENNREPVNMSLDAGGKLRQFFAAFVRSSNNPHMRDQRQRHPDVEQAVDDYCLIRPNQPFYNLRGMGNVITNVVKGYNTNCQNHVVTNISTRVRKVVYHFLSEHAWFEVLKANRKSCIVDYVMKVLERDPTADDLPGPSSVLTCAHLHYFVNPRLVGTVEEEQEDGRIVFRDAQPRDVDFDELDDDIIIPLIDCLATDILAIIERVQVLLDHQTLFEKTVKKNWYHYLRPLYRILDLMSTFLIAYEDNPARIRRSRFKLFNLLPVTHFASHYVLYDTTCMVETLRRCGLVQLTLSEFLNLDAEDQLDRVWYHFFNLSKVLSAGRQFGCSICTDGVGCSVSITKRAPHKPVVQLDEYGYTMGDDRQYVPMDLRPSHNIRDYAIPMRRRLDNSEDYQHVADLVGVVQPIFLDPGQLDLFVAGREYHPLQNTSTVSCSNGEWQEISGNRRGGQTRERFLNSNPMMKQIVEGIPTCKVTSVERYDEYLVYVLANLFGDHGLLAFYGSKRHRQLRWGSHIRKSKAFDTICKRITGNRPESVVVYGGGRWSGVKGSPTVPNKQLYQQLRQRCRVRLLWEYNTSKVCSKDQCFLNDTRTWHVKTCPTCLVSII
jgi:hypothetical protein